jgi:hypothetical protein
VTASALAQTGPCTAEGTVRQDGNGAPVARARVLFRKSGAGSQLALGYFTDDNGRFRAEGLDQATYGVSVHKVGFLPPVAARRPRSGARLELTNACQQTGLQYLLIPSAILSGRLTDTNGQPAARAGVEAQRRAWLNGRWQFRTVSTASANAQGEFRISRLPAGQYVLRAQPGGPMTVSFRDPSGPTHYAAPAYYPGVYEAAKAQIITVDTGVELGGFDFGPMLVPFFTVSGRVLDAEGQGAPSRCQVLLRPAIGGGEERIARYSAQTGEFIFPEVAPGKYQLLAYAAGATTIGTASRELELTENNAAGLQLQLEPPFAVQGRATLQGGALPLGAIQVILLPTTPKAAAASPALVEDDGTFTVPLVSHDRYRILVTSNQPNIYLKSVSEGGKPQPGHWIDWTFGGPRQISVLLANDGGRLEAEFNGDSGPAENIYVVLVPADMDKLAGSTLMVGQAGIVRRSSLVQSGGVVRLGAFRMANIPPGDYLAYAFGMGISDGDSDPAMLADPAWVPYYKGPGTPVRIEPNAQARIALDILPLP